MDEQIILEAQNWFVQNQKSIQKSAKNALQKPNRDPDWKNVNLQTHRSKQLLELPLLYNQKNLKSKATPRDNEYELEGVTRLLLRKNEDNSFSPVIMRIYADKKSQNQLKNNSFTRKQNDFTGEVYFYDWDENLLGANCYKDGKVIKYFDAVATRQKACVTITKVYIFIGGSGSAPELDDVSQPEDIIVYETVCWSNTTSGPNTPGGLENGGTSGGGSGSQGYDPYANPESGIPDGENLNLVPRKITLDLVFQNNTKAMCVYNRLKVMIENNKSSNLFWRLTLPFSGNGPNLEINLKDSLSNDDLGQTSGDFLPDKVPIYLSKRHLERLGPLQFAQVMLHELMHAYFLAKLQEIGGLSNLDTHIEKLRAQNDSVPKLLLDLQWAYKNFPPTAPEYGNKPHHNLMAQDTYREFFKNALKAWNEGANPAPSDDEYEALTWTGLRASYVASWDKKSEADKDKIRKDGANALNKSGRCN